MIRRARPLLPFALLLPAIGFLALLVPIPIGQTLVLVITSEAGLNETFQRMLGDAGFADALRNTLVLLLVLAPVQVALALLMALLVGSGVRGHGFLFYLFAIPLLVSDLVGGFVWLALFTERGYLNSALQSVGVIGQPIPFLAVEALWPIVVAEAWRGTAVAFVILLAGVRLIPRDVVETAELMGAGRLRRTLGVVLPLLRPSLQSALVVRAVFVLQTFAVAFVLADGNTPVLASGAYSAHAAERDASLAAAYTLFIFALTAVGMALYLPVLLSPSSEPRTMSPRVLSGPLAFGGAIVLALWVLIPIYLLAASALTPPGRLFEYPKPFIPTGVSTEALDLFAAAAGIFPSAVNSLAVAGITSVLCLALGAPAGYALARMRFRGRGTVLTITQLLRVAPIAVLSIPLSIGFVDVGLYDNVLGVALVHTAIALPFVILLARGVFSAASGELEDVAQTLGSSRWAAVRRVILPLATPGLFAAALIAFAISWSEVFAASVLTLRQPTLPAQVFASLATSPLTFKLAAGVVLLVPTALIALVTRRYLLYIWGAR